jgi:hypothetical protein
VTSRDTEAQALRLAVQKNTLRKPLEHSQPHELEHQILSLSLSSQTLARSKVLADLPGAEIFIKRRWLTQNVNWLAMQTLISQG